MALNIFILFSLSLIPEAEPPDPRSQAQPGNEISEALPRFLEALPRFLEALPRFLEALPRFLEALPRFLEALPRLSKRHSPLQCLCN
ncbi:hypothetical protein MiSe_84870 [Microseira wollei NIES-4236]|uniref:Uncharacterized protein n=1 Tax=Microseira wollei NIES-4236 TaxID=2530354 RepID=A0AAV3XTW2_9CYAN|nr:hypothetical protein MiSe_84870 [Microseira wollei NIES-4236]